MSLGKPLLTPPVVPAAARPEQPPLAEHIHARLPKIWVGYAFAVAVFALLLVGKSSPDDSKIDVGALGLLLFFVGWFYWMFCVYRIHRVLKEATYGAYPISPRRAAGFQFIPIYNLIWVFKWPKRIAEFVNARTNSHRMSRFLPATLLLIAGFVGQSGMLAPLHLLIIFGVGDYLARRIKHVLPTYAPKTVVMRRDEHQLNLSVSAGLGAAFSFVLCQAVLRFEWKDALAIALVSLAVVKFLEPVFEHLKAALGIEEHHDHHIGSWRLKLAIWVILMLASFCHGLLHKEIGKELEDDALGTVVAIAGAALISGGITYAWANGARRSRPRAARFGLLGGAVIGSLVCALVFVGMNNGSHKVSEAEPPGSLLGTGATLAAERASPVSPQLTADVLNNIGSGEVQKAALLDLKKLALPWTIFGLVGGLAIDRKWGQRASRSVAVAIAATAIVFFVAGATASGWLAGTYFALTPGEAAAYILAVIGWGASLLCFPSADKVVQGAHAPGRTYLKILGQTRNPST
jgi:hypothetical protein